MNIVERWINIKVYEGLYQISNLGRVKSLKFNKEKILKDFKNLQGYRGIELRDVNNKRKKFLVHRLVAINFLKNHDNELEVNHKNKIRDDNNLKNLEWITKENNIFFRDDIFYEIKNMKKYLIDLIPLN